MQRPGVPRVGLGYDVHPFAPIGSDRPLVLGGVVIPDCVGLVGHSDADAVAHAVADALLGPRGHDDLGTLFPASDSRYAGANSMELLTRCVAKVVRSGWLVSNVDVVITAERPRLAPYLSEMRINVAEALAALAIEPDGGVFVSITPKRGEGIGSIGRAEGIEVRAVALLVSR